jgi:hypothetical protein
MRIKPDGSLDLDWRERLPSYRPRTAEDYEDIREKVISEHLRDHPNMTRKEVEDELEDYGF